MSNVPACLHCGAPIGAVTAEVDPQTIGHRYRAQCGHVIDADEARDLWKRGYRWTLPVLDGASLSAAERRRQVTEEGYTPLTDASVGDELAWAAWSYVDVAMHQETSDEPQEPPAAWPWSPEAWKATASPLRRLVIASALIQAEIDRRLHDDRVRG